ncbi:MAG: MgtC/SapB family protein [Chloroflexota bacterium]|nr:MgtC/SapB family protein [Chloroflexota bacterium]
MLVWVEIPLKMFLAMFLGGLIGWEREVEGKPAGLRTIMLVCLSACIYVLSVEWASAGRGCSMDVARVMCGISEGVGFLGAGLILRSGGTVRLLTTAATVWAAAAVGFAVGLGLYYIAILGSALVFVILKWLENLEERWLGSDKDAE